MSDNLKLSPEGEEITQEKFDRMPALLSAFQVKRITGFTDHELADAVKDGQIKTYRRPPRPGRKRAYSKYTKTSVAVVVGFRI